LTGADNLNKIARESALVRHPTPTRRTVGNQ